jgi:hypothetical protein
MIPINDTDTARQQARTWAQGPGNLAAASPAISREPAVTQLGPPAFPARLSSILNHFRQRARRSQHSADTLRAEEFLSGT